jgi:hypothetical protein
MAKRGKGSKPALQGNKNASGKHKNKPILMGNVAGFFTGMLQPARNNADSRALYERKGYGMTGHTVGKTLRSVSGVNLFLK